MERIDMAHLQTDKEAVDTPYQFGQSQLNLNRTKLEIRNTAKIGSPHRSQKHSSKQDTLTRLPALLLSPPRGSYKEATVLETTPPSPAPPSAFPSSFSWNCGRLGDWR